MSMSDWEGIRAKDDLSNGGGPPTARPKTIRLPEGVEPCKSLWCTYSCSTFKRCRPNAVCANNRQCEPAIMYLMSLLPAITKADGSPLED